MIIFVQLIETRSNLSKPLKFYHSENHTNQQKHVQIYPNDLLKHYIQQKYEFFIKLNHLLSHWKTHFFRIYYRNTWRETHPSSRYQSAVCGIGFCPFFFSFFLFSPLRNWISLHANQPLVLLRGEKIFPSMLVYCWSQKLFERDFTGKAIRMCSISDTSLCSSRIIGYGDREIGNFF